jgi:hypothetical protein
MGGNFPEGKLSETEREGAANYRKPPLLHESAVQRPARSAREKPAGSARRGTQREGDG